MEAKKVLVIVMRVLHVEKKINGKLYVRDVTISDDAEQAITERGYAGMRRICEDGLVRQAAYDKKKAELREKYKPLIKKAQKPNPLAQWHKKD